MKQLNKKAISNYTPETTITYIVFCFFLSFALIVLMITIYSYLEDTARTPKGIEEFSAIERFLSSECFALDDINPPKTISWNKFKKENLDSCYNIEEESEKIAFSLKLQTADKETEIRTNNWDEEIALKETKSPIKVYVYDNDKIVDGSLIISEQNV